MSYPNSQLEDFILKKIKEKGFNSNFLKKHKNETSPRMRTHRPSLSSKEEKSRNIVDVPEGASRKLLKLNIEALQASARVYPIIIML